MVSYKALNTILVSKLFTEEGIVIDLSPVQ